MILILGALFPAGLMAGANFPLILAAAGTTSHRARLLSRMYGWEALGGTVAGLLFALALVYWLNPVGIIMSAAWLSCLAALICHRGRVRIAVFLCLALAALGLALSSGIDRDLKERLWAGRNLVAWTESPYAQLAAVRQPGQMDFFASGSWLFSHPDRLRLERAALLPLLAAPHAHKALFLGGGPSRIANEAARRGRLQHVTALELDPWIWRLAQEMPPLQKPPATMQVVFDDGRTYLKNTSNRFDLVVVDMPPPSTVQNNRYYTEEGFQALARVLNPRGVAVVSLPGVEYLVGRLQAARLNTIIKAAKQAFAEVVIMSGPELRLFMSPSPGVVSANPADWIENLSGYHWKQVAAVRPDTLSQELNPQRLAFLKAALQRAETGAANRDLQPRAILYDSQLWGARLGRLSGLAYGLARLQPWHLFLPLAVVMLAGWGLCAHRRTIAWLGRCLVPLGLFCCGLTAMSATVLLLLAYQVLFGAVYVGLALVVAGFMAGTAVAALWAGAGLERLRRPLAALSLNGLALTLACLVALGLIKLLHAQAHSDCWSWALVAMAAVIGGLTGAYFGLAGRLGLDRAGRVQSLALVGGRTYGMDLTGGVLGALVPIVLVPTVGLGWSLALLGCINLVPLAVLAGFRWRGTAAA
jgi:spermidine synthase